MGETNSASRQPCQYQTDLERSIVCIFEAHHGAMLVGGPEATETKFISYSAVSDRNFTILYAVLKPWK